MNSSMESKYPPTASKLSRRVPSPQSPSSSPPCVLSAAWPCAGGAFAGSPASWLRALWMNRPSRSSRTGARRAQRVILCYRQLSVNREFREWGSDTRWGNTETVCVTWTLNLTQGRPHMWRNKVRLLSHLFSISELVLFLLTGDKVCLFSSSHKVIQSHTYRHIKHGVWGSSSGNFRESNTYIPYTTIYIFSVS